MATRAQIDRIARQVDKLASTLNEANVAYVPIYDGESEHGALEAYGQPHHGGVIFGRARPGDRRADCERSGVDALFRLGPSDMRRLLSETDGKTRGIATICNLTSERGSST